MLETVDRTKKEWKKKHDKESNHIKNSLIPNSIGLPIHAKLINVLEYLKRLQAARDDLTENFVKEFDATNNPEDIEKLTTHWDIQYQHLEGVWTFVTSQYEEERRNEIKQRKVQAKHLIEKADGIIEMWKEQAKTNAPAYAKLLEGKQINDIEEIKSLIGGLQEKAKKREKELNGFKKKITQENEDYLKLIEEFQKIVDEGTQGWDEETNRLLDLYESLSN